MLEPTAHRARRDYSLTGPEAARAAEKGLVSANWYQSPISRKRMKELMQRRDGPALLDTAIWAATLLATGFGGYWFWGSWACVPFFLVYGVLWRRQYPLYVKALARNLLCKQS